MFTVHNKDWFFKRGPKENLYGYSRAEHGLGGLKNVLKAGGFKITGFHGTFFMPKRSLFLKAAEKLGVGWLALGVMVHIDRLLDCFAFTRKKTGGLVVTAKKVA
ncbi:MAG: hypothetical protein KAW41_00480 [Candidatus Diapherotrites archaeon]|nr:hypothetical protein [Candidatus Diapherotrites archaeon]